MLVGNKKDLESGREVKYDEGKKKQTDFNLDGFCEISAKNGEELENLFKQVSRILYRDIFNDNDIASEQKRKIKLITYSEENNKKTFC